MKSNHGNGAWDEQKWESHINEIEQKNHQFKNFLESNLGGDSPRWYRILKESPSEYEALDSYIEEELYFEDPYYPDDEDDWDIDDEPDDDIFFLYDEDLSDDAELYSDLDDELLDDEFDDDILDELDELDEGEEWKLLSDDFAMSDAGSLENLAIYKQAHSLGVRLLKMADEHPHVLENQTYNEFVSLVLQISAKLTAGYTYGFASDMIGGNIAYSKKALYAANEALSALQSLKSKQIFPTADQYYQLHAILFEVRNDLGIYIQDLREYMQKDW